MLLLWLAWCSWIASVVGQELPDTVLQDVKTRLGEGALLSWEIGTRIQALLEFDSPDYSVLTTYPQPVSIPFPSQASVPASLGEVMSIVRIVVANRTTSNFGLNATTTTTGASSNATRTLTGPQPLISDASSADPVSIGQGVLLAAYFNLDGNGTAYMQAAQDQLDFLYTKVPKTSDGAISHRVAEVQLWSDYVSMVPPFLALYGVLSSNLTLIRDAHTQIRLYRAYLVNDSRGKTKGLWRHVLLGSGRNGQPSNDEGFWSSGNGWAAHGMLRVLATIKHSPYSDEFRDEQGDLLDWSQEIIGAMYGHIDSTSLFTNYADNQSTFHDAASTALLAASAYRLSLLSDGTESHWIPYAERSRKALSCVAGNSNSSLVHFTSDGWVDPVVNPHWYAVQGKQSPEAQAFVLMMESAWKEWVAAGSIGINASRRAAIEWWWLAGTVLMGLWTII